MNLHAWRTKTFTFVDRKTHHQKLIHPSGLQLPGKVVLFPQIADGIYGDGDLGQREHGGNVTLVSRCEHQSRQDPHGHQ